MKRVKTQDIPIGTIHVADFSELNWLYVLFNTMEEPVRADREGSLISSLAREMKWVNEHTLQLRLHVTNFHNGQQLSAADVKYSFDEMQKWNAPHPPGTWLNLPEGTTCTIINSNTIQFKFLQADGLAPGKMRAFHIGNQLFWQTIGFGYASKGSGEGHW